MLGFNQQITRYQFRISRFISQRNGLTGASRQSDIDRPIEQAFRCCNKPTARARYLMHAGNSGRSIGQGSNRLSAADAIYFMDATQVRGHQRCRVHFPSWSWRRADNDARHPGYAGRGSQHIHHRGKGSFSTRNVKPYAANWRDLLSRHYPWSYFCKPLLMRHLSLVKRAHIANGVLDCLAYREVKGLLGLFNLRVAHRQTTWRQLHTVKAFRELQQRLISPLSNALENWPHPLGQLINLNLSSAQ